MKSRSCLKLSFLAVLTVTIFGCKTSSYSNLSEGSQTAANSIDFEWKDQARLILFCNDPKLNSTLAEAASFAAKKINNLNTGWEFEQIECPTGTIANSMPLILIKPKRMERDRPLTAKEFQNIGFYSNIDFSSYNDAESYFRIWDKIHGTDLTKPGADDEKVFVTEDMRTTLMQFTPSTFVEKSTQYSTAIIYVNEHEHIKWNSTYGDQSPANNQSISFDPYIAFMHTFGRAMRLKPNLKFYNEYTDHDIANYPCGSFYSHYGPEGLDDAIQSADANPDSKMHAFNGSNGEKPETALKNRLLYDDKLKYIDNLGNAIAIDAKGADAAEAQYWYISPGENKILDTGIEMPIMQPFLRLGRHCINPTKDQNIKSNGGPTQANPPTPMARYNYSSSDIAAMKRSFRK